PHGRRHFLDGGPAFRRDLQRPGDRPRPAENGRRPAGDAEPAEREHLRVRPGPEGGHPKGPTDDHQVGRCPRKEPTMNEQLHTPSPDRGTNFRRAALAGAGLAAGLLAANRAAAVTPPLTFKDIPGTGDVKVLNYALALEQLEADLYHQAILRLTTGGTNALGKDIPGLHLSPDQQDVFFVKEFGKVEREHRDFLTKALGANAINPFKYDFGIHN